MQQSGPTFPSVPSHGCDPTSLSTPQSTQVVIHLLKPSQTYLKFSALRSQPAIENRNWKIEIGNWKIETRKSSAVFPSTVYRLLSAVLLATSF